MSNSLCFHCNEPVLTGSRFITHIDGNDQIMCCPGCQAVSQSIVDAGLLSYYKYRTEPGSRQTALVPESLSHYSAYDLPEVQQDFVQGRDGFEEVSLSIDGITCAACAWLIEHKLQKIEGVARIQVNSTTQRAYIRWQASKVKLSELLSAIASIGYSAAPFQLDDQEVISKKNSRRFLLRLGLAGFATMQVMMFALALYNGYFTDLEAEYRDYFRWVSMIFAAPVVFYSAQPFYFSAIRAILSGKLNMDVSVSIAICGAYIASCVATINGTGEVYFESVSMFTFFLLLGRYFEQRARQKASVSSSNLHKLVPLTASLVTAGGIEEVPAKKLAIGDIILVRPGDVIAADGDIIDGSSGVNEAMLTGEQLPVAKAPGMAVYAGTINLEQPLQIKVTALGQDQLVAEIIRLQELASNAKPAIALTADKLARYFSATILTIATITYFVWRQFAPEDAFWVTLSVLVATCPCALALATPTAVTCATGLFTRLGIISRNGTVFEKLPRLDTVVFDKTGTLTCGEFSFGDIKLYQGLERSEALALASSLEQGSLHPIAKLFARAEPASAPTDLTHFVGEGVQGTIDGSTLRIGSASFAQVPETLPEVQREHGQWVYLSKLSEAGFKLIAAFEIQDELRTDAKETLAELKARGLGLAIASGDSSHHLQEVGSALGVTDIKGALRPQDKLALIEALRQSGKTVAMFGDGINDAPVLAGADLSVAMGSGSAIAKNSADLILLGDHLHRFVDALDIAKRTSNIIRQNLAWALGYNVLILPLAVTGHVVPYIAAIGMSASSLIVVGNSLRLLRIKP
ncbi:cadmium-translocating P-type ATPase [Shewanella sp. JM162201]|uniref:Cadmium-translocating P-type ATPase n=1 Tax=Shewanella jiangmenensis TaxID=2837387 RepID=A0ABS5V636_9GAMM|nr:heavy metal translocating P-type ATPase metal-binding domain-containing protein [Shewanella jiangmenensis]MBT1445912.1 cadmium-translocating P-type ATPase [Shewanella jiangmenensis]